MLQYSGLEYNGEPRAHRVALFNRLGHPSESEVATEFLPRLDLFWISPISSPELLRDRSPNENALQLSILLVR